MKKWIVAIALSAAITGQAEARDQLWLVGSSTVYPFATAVAEQFGSSGEFRKPIVESTGTGGGFKLFCAAVSEDSPDFANASRQIKSSELEQCAKNGIKDPLEIKFGLDGLVLASSKKSPQFHLTKKQIFLALAREIPREGKLIANPYKNWNEVDPSLPNKKIEVLGPPPTSGTRDAFVELVMEKACDSFTEYNKAYPDKEAHKKQCAQIREDGAFVEAGENDNLIIQKLDKNPDALGIFGFSFMEENQDKVQASIIENVAATPENVVAGTYPISRPLFIYAKREHIGKIPGMKEFVKELTGEQTIGDEGYLVEKGLIPLKAQDRKAVAQKADALK